MKSLKLLIISLLFTCSLFAASGGNSTSESGSADKISTDSGSTFSIDNNVWYLIIVGSAIGCKIIWSKNEDTAQPSEL